MKRLATVFLCIACCPGAASAQDGPAYTRTQDVVYGRKFGTALTLDVKHQPQRRRGVRQARLHRLRGRPRQSAEIHDPRNPRRHAPGGSLHPLPCEGLQDRSRSARHLRRVRRRPPVADARDRRQDGRPQGRRSDRPSLQPGAGRRLLLPADRLPQLRREGQRSARPRHPFRLQGALCVPDLRPEGEGVRAGDRRGEDSGNRPDDLAGESRHAGRYADADHSRRRRQAGADPASRTHHGEVQGSGCAGRVDRPQRGGARLEEPSRGPGALR